MSAITTAPTQVGNGKVVHYVRKDAFHSHTIGCGRLVSRELTAQEAADRKVCGPCKRAVEVLATEPPAETEALAAGAAEQAPAAPAEDDQAAKVADIERRVRPLDADTVTAATMFDPELTYYTDGTRVVMRAKDAERTGTTFGMAGSGLPNGPSSTTRRAPGAWHATPRTATWWWLTARRWRSRASRRTRPPTPACPRTP